MGSSNPLATTLTKLIARVEAAAPVRGRFGQSYHLMPPVGWMNDPNGLCQVGGTFHAYFQYAPFDAEGGLVCWGHATSRDLLHWDYRGPAILPDQPFDCHGAYSGSALVEDGRVRMYYTGNVKRVCAGEDFDYVNSGREGNTIMVESVDGGMTFGPKGLLMTNDDYPSDLSCHVRDPKVWREGDRYLMVQGARTHDSVGEVLVFSSADGLDWELASRVTTPEPFGYMWECPDFMVLDDEDGSKVQVLSVSPQGLEGEGWDRRNTYQSGHFLLEGDLTGVHELRDFALWDAGFDFYAPQTFEAQDGRRILIGWMGMPDTPEVRNKTIDDGWQHCLTVPREVTVAGGVVRQAPVRELAALRANGEEATGALERVGSPCVDLEVSGIGDRLRIELADELSLAWSVDDPRLELRFADGSRQGVGAGRGVRWEPLARLRNLRVITDTSSVEVFANDGELVMTTRYYPERQALRVDAPGSSMRVWDLEA